MSNETGSVNHHGMHGVLAQGVAAEDKVFVDLHKLVSLVHQAKRAGTQSECLDVCLQWAEQASNRIAELEAAQRWIPVSERLPEEGGVYWVLCRREKEPRRMLFDKTADTFMGPAEYWIEWQFPAAPAAEER